MSIALVLFSTIALSLSPIAIFVATNCFVLDRLKRSQRWTYGHVEPSHIRSNPAYVEACNKELERLAQQVEEIESNQESAIDSIPTPSPNTQHWIVDLPTQTAHLFDRATSTDHHFECIDASIRLENDEVCVRVTLIHPMGDPRVSSLMDRTSLRFTNFVDLSLQDGAIEFELAEDQRVGLPLGSRRNDANTEARAASVRTALLGNTGYFSGMEATIISGNAGAIGVPEICRGCRNLHGQVYNRVLLVCGMHPKGAIDGECRDFEAR